MKKQYKLIIERVNFRGSTHTTRREVEGDLDYLRKHFGIASRTVKELVEKANKEFARRQAFSYIATTVHLVEAK